MGVHVGIFLLALVGLLGNVNGLTGNKCTRLVETFVTERVCAYNTWLGCCVWRYKRVCKLVDEDYCCDGWLDDGTGNCNVAICSEGCINGKCTKPNNCVCDLGFTGTSCGTVACSHLKPCYPGVCGANEKCTCTDGFKSEFCLTTDTEPEFTIVRAKIANYKAMKDMDIYNLTTDSSNSSSTDLIWTNMQIFNNIKIDLQALFKQDILPIPPSYVTSAKFGIVEAKVEYDQKSKAGATKGTNTKICSQSMSATNPTNGVFNCTILDGNDLRIDTGDILTLKYTVKSGGFEQLNAAGKAYQTKTFSGPTKSKSVIFKFDHDVPQHCSELSNCGSGTNYPLKILNDVTKDPVEIQWGGWTDADSGMYRYALEVFNLTKQGDLLLEIEPLKPADITEFNQTISDQSYSYNYTPPVAGMYSVILEAADTANNSRYLRRFFMYDPTSSITFGTGSSATLKVSSASSGSNYTWQANKAKTATDVTVNWENHFINKVHVDGGFLNRILDYPAQLLDIEVSSEHKKKIDAKITDNTVKRTSSSIANKNGIIRFEYNKATKIFGQNPEEPSTGWQKIDPLAEELKLTYTANDGDCLMIWIRAFDFIENNNTDATLVCFDSTQPIFRTAQLAEKNIPTSNFNAASRVSFTVLDKESGIQRIEWKTVDNTTDKLIKTGTPVEGNVTSTLHQGIYRSCNKPDIVNDNQESKINEDGFTISDLNWKKIVNTGSFKLAVEERYNYKTKSQCDQEGGCYCVTSGECFLEDYTMELDHCALYQEGVNLAASIVRVEMTVFNRAMLTTTYTFTISEINTFDGMSHCESILRLVSPAQEGLTAGGIAGVSIAIILALAFVAFVIFLWRTGRLQKIKEQSVEKIYGMRSSVRRGNVGAIGYKQYQTGGFDEEDIYLYGTQTYETTPDWLLKPENLVLGSVLKEGRFARIYHAVLYVGGKPTNAVAKTLKENFSEQDSILMTAKINFFGTKVGRHNNVLGFIGGITGDPTMGPVMILELCEKGPMKDWLIAHKSKVNDTSLEKLYRFSFDIVRGMEHLASKEIIHMRLAARNIFITASYEAKIAGFGPRHGDDEEEGGKKERIPVKWIAPECFDNPKAASEKSDVWSFGVVLWELFTFGDNPYADIRSQDLPRHLRRGDRLDKPEYCDDTHYNIMKNSWQKSPKARQNFSSIRKTIESMFKENDAGESYYYDSNVR